MKIFHLGECHSPPAHMALGYPYFLENRGTDGRTTQTINLLLIYRGSLKEKLANEKKIGFGFGFHTKNCWILGMDMKPIPKTQTQFF